MSEIYSNFASPKVKPEYIMKKFFATILTTLCLTASATPAPDPEFAHTSSGDVLMPSLSEMLGEEVDNFGEWDANAAIKEQLVEYANQHLGTRYRGGGKGPSGFDCSGFTSYVFRNIGYVLSPSSRLQGTQGEEIPFDEVEVGDLMFFSGRRGGSTIGHVGMVIDIDRENGTVKFIHASSSQGVVIQNFPDGGYYSNRFLHARRVLSDGFEPTASAE